MAVIIEWNGIFLAPRIGDVIEALSPSLGAAYVWSVQESSSKKQHFPHTLLWKKGISIPKCICKF